MREAIPDIFDLPKDVLLDLPRITIVGGHRAAVENHRGIVRYQQHSLTIGYSSGRVIFEGDDLTVHSISSEEVVVEGRIEAVVLQPDEVQDE